MAQCIIARRTRVHVHQRGKFREALALRYNKPLRGLPSKCPCGQTFGAIIRHNNIRDFEANPLLKIYNDVETEAVNDELITDLTGIESKPDIRATDVWRTGQNAYFDVRITNVNADSQKKIIQFQRY